jgi:bifunctional non-homologous end joining protein LigD
MMLASGAPPSTSGWVAQPKMDGWRGQVFVDGQSVRVWSRNGHLLKVPELDVLPELLHGRRVRLDGELVVMAGAVADFHALSDRMFRGPTRSAHQLGLLAFDLLALDGRDMTNQPWQARQDALQGLSLRSSVVGVLPVLHDVDEAWTQAKADGWEGVVYKHTGSVWRAGERSPHWRKRKVWERVSGRIVAVKMVDTAVEALVVETATHRVVVELAVPSSSWARLRTEPQNRRGWCTVLDGPNASVQYRRGPSGDIREPVLLNRAADGV